MGDFYMDNSSQEDSCDSSNITSSIVCVCVLTCVIVAISLPRTLGGHLCCSFSGAYILF